MRHLTAAVAGSLLLAACTTGAGGASSAASGSGSATSSGAMPPASSSAGRPAPNSTSPSRGASPSETTPAPSAPTSSATPALARRPTDADLAKVVEKLPAVDDTSYEVTSVPEIARARQYDQDVSDSLRWADITPSICTAPYYQYRTAMSADLARAAGWSDSTGVGVTIWQLDDLGAAERAVDTFETVVERCPDVTAEYRDGTEADRFGRREVDVEADAAVAAVVTTFTDGKPDREPSLVGWARLGEYVVEADVELTGRVPTDDDLALAGDVLTSLVDAVRELRGGGRSPSTTSSAAV